MKVRNVFVTLLILALVVGAFGSLAASGCAPEPEKEKVFRFGVVFGLSGAGAAWGWQGLLGSDLAVEDINARGGIQVGGEWYRVERLVYDAAWDPVVTATVVRKAVLDDGLKFLHVQSTAEGLAVVDFTTEQEVLLKIEGPVRILGPDYPFTFQAHFEFSDNDEVMADYILGTYPHLTRLLLLNPDCARGRPQGALAEEYLAELGFTLVDSLYIPLGTTDFYPVLVPALAKGIDIINTGCLAPDERAILIKQAFELGFRGVTVHPDSLPTAILLDIAGKEALEGAVGAPQLVEMPTEQSREYERRYVERYGTFIYWPIPNVYDPHMLMFAAIEKADSFDPVKVAEALGTVRIEGVLGKEVGFFTNIYTPDLPRAMKSPVFVVEIRDGVEVDVASGYGRIWMD